MLSGLAQTVFAEKVVLLFMQCLKKNQNNKPKKICFGTSYTQGQVCRNSVSRNKGADN